MKVPYVIATMGMVLWSFGGNPVAAQAPGGNAKGALTQATAVQNETGSFDIDALLNQTLEAGKGADLVHKGKNGAWVLARGKGAPATCAVIYFDRSNGTSLAYRGPRPEVGDKGSLVFMGPAIPDTRTAQTVRVVLETEGERPQTVPAGHLPKQDQVPAAILVSTDIRATIAVIQPTEKVRLSLGGSLVYSLAWDGGGHEAKAALMNCLRGG